MEGEFIAIAIALPQRLVDMQSVPKNRRNSNKKEMDKKEIKRKEKETSNKEDDVTFKTVSFLSFFCMEALLFWP